MIFPRSASTSVTVSSDSTTAVLVAMLTVAECTPGMRFNCFSAPRKSRIDNMPPTSRTAFFIRHSLMEDHAGRCHELAGWTRLQAFGASELYTRPKITAAIQANTTFQMTPSINCPTDPIGLVEYKLSQLCVSSALGNSSAARKQRTNRTTNVAVRPQPNGTI